MLNGSDDFITNKYNIFINTNISEDEYAHVKVNLSDFDLELHINSYIGERRKGLSSTIILTIVYVGIFLSGLMGNLCTCVVVWKNIYMHTVTNYYLTSLAISDILMLIFALPPEVYTIWEAYPWRLGEPFCIFKSFLLESTSYASVLTITGFTIERYIAICHPMLGQNVSRQSRAVKCIAVIWAVATISALPYPIHTRTFYYLEDPRNKSPIPDTLLCNIPLQWHNRMIIMFQVSTFAFLLFTYDYNYNYVYSYWTEIT
ncbi:hypothetical protein KUTeg_007424 [Tegillarca granosa]|uniref:G-protein coupled receptors family 1 profile domain-containing protein n=1 Tax=Tegillarca granosa TaxID=220873 RepID=A0ABQ9FD91_TEGGR|nr:hypothetical protein KUTeg_007424 [Tegillarca granosa]